MKVIKLMKPARQKNSSKYVPNLGRSRDSSVDCVSIMSNKKLTQSYCKLFPGIINTFSETSKVIAIGAVATENGSLLTVLSVDTDASNALIHASSPLAGLHLVYYS